MRCVARTHEAREPTIAARFRVHHVFLFFLSLRLQGCYRRRSLPDTPLASASEGKIANARGFLKGSRPSQGNQRNDYRIDREFAESVEYIRTYTRVRPDPLYRSLVGARRFSFLTHDAAVIRERERERERGGALARDSSASVYPLCGETCGPGRRAAGYA